MGRVKKALSNLVSDGVLTGAGVGHYILTSRDGEPNTPIGIESADEAPAADDLDGHVADEIVFELDLGAGSQTVYAFYLPTYRDGGCRIRSPISGGGAKRMG